MCTAKLDYRGQSFSEVRLGLLGYDKAVKF